MIKTIIPLASLLFVLASCNTNATKQKDAHDHSAHDHASHEGHDHAKEDDHAGHDHAEGEGHKDEIVFTEAQAKAAGLQTQILTPGQFHNIVKTSGQIQSAQGDEQTIVATSNGTVTFSNSSIAEGSAVRAGESVVTISAKNLLEGDPSAKARIEFETAKKELQRGESLVKDQIISDKDFQLIRLRYETAKTTYDAQAANVTSKGIRVTAPISGFIKSRMVNQGEYVTVGQPIAVVSQNRKLQLKADLSERYYKSIKGISTANFRAAYDTTVYRLSELNGRLLSFGRSTNTNSAFIPVIFEFDNRGDLLPGAFLDVYLISNPLQDVLSIPLTAVTDEQGLHFVYLRIGKEAFKKQEVQLGQSDGRRVHITGGLEKGQEVVTKGAYQVKIAANASIIPEGHTH